MKRKLLAMLIVVMAIASLVLAGCGGGGNATQAAGDTGGNAGGAETEAAAAPSGETYDVGDFTFTLPAGWKDFPQEDIFEDADENGNRPLDPSMIYVSKDAKNELELLSAPYVLINYYPASTTLMDSKDFYDNVSDLDVTVQGKAADYAYEGDSTIIEGWRYQIIKFSTDNAQFMVTIPTTIDGKASNYSYDNAEIQTILESLAGK